MSVVRTAVGRDAGPVLQARGLRKSYGGIDAVRDFSCEVAAGEMLALIGPNGAGKSTCFAMLGGQIRPDGGEIRIGGRRLERAGPRAVWRLGVGRTFQITATFASMTVLENVQMALLAHRGEVWRFRRGLAGRHADAAAALLEPLGLAGQTGRAAGVLAYGDLKRLELAMALAAAPRLLLMDEPTAGMAPEERAALMHLTRGLAQARGLAVLFTEHDMDTVFSVADRILVLDRGALIAAGTAAEVRADARVRAVYLGAAP
jgi:branched-chain amino acid transport system ATP-binding protein